MHNKNKNNFSPPQLVPLSTMDQVQNLDHRDENPSVDTSRPFRSVKEAVAVLSERFSAMQIYSPKPFPLPDKDTPIISAPSPELKREEPSSKHPSPSPPINPTHSHETTLVDTVRKLQAELDRTKAELKLLKEKGSETEFALASLNVELRKSMSKLERAETAGKETKRDPVIGKMSSSSSGPLPSLAQVLSVGEDESWSLGRKKVMKKKPIVPLVKNLLFFRKKDSNISVDDPLYASSPLRWN